MADGTRNVVTANRVQELEDELARLRAEMSGLTLWDQNNRDVPPGLPSDRAFTSAVKLTDVAKFNGNRNRARAFCSEVTWLLEPYNQMDTRDGFLWASGRLAGDARVWYESQMQLAPVDTCCD